MGEEIKPEWDLINTSMRLLVLLLLILSTAQAAEFDFDKFANQAGDCQLVIPRQKMRKIPGNASAVVGSLPNGGAINGVVITGFVIVSRGVGQQDDYGLLFSAPLDIVSSKFPELAKVQYATNGYTRSLMDLSSLTLDAKDRSKTVLFCHSGLKV
jgi:hypothetical protein